MARKHHSLLVWREAISLVKSVYDLTARFPAREAYVLGSQMRRAAISVPSNIAEGAGRSGHREFLKFLAIARGSLSELETQVIIARELGYIEGQHPADRKIEHVFCLLGALINSVRKKENRA